MPICARMVSKKAGQFLRRLDLLAEREGFEPSVQLSSARHYREHKEVKSGSQSLRFVIAKNSSTKFAKSDLATAE